MERILIPINNISNPINIAHSLDNRFAKLGANGDIIANAMTGKLVNNPALELDKPTSA